MNAIRTTICVTAVILGALLAFAQTELNWDVDATKPAKEYIIQAGHGESFFVQPRVMDGETPRAFSGVAAGVM